MKTGDLVHLKQPNHGVNRIGVVVGINNQGEHKTNPTIQILWCGGTFEGWNYAWFKLYHEVISNESR